MARVVREWNGPEILRRSNRAAGRGIIGFAVLVSRETKIITHKMSGTLARSVHAAPAHYELGESDEKAAESGMDLGMVVPSPTHTPIGPAVEVGSWVSYACVEWVGRGHPGVTQGLEAARPRADAIFLQAYKEEGL